MRTRKVIDPKTRRLIILGMLEYNKIMSRRDLCSLVDISLSTLSTDLRVLRGEGCVFDCPPRTGLVRYISGGHPEDESEK